MKRFWTAWAVTFFALGVLAGCNDYNTSIQYSTGATITNLSPSAITAGAAPSNAVNCPNTPSGQTNPCFTLTVVASSFNGFQTNTIVEWNGLKLPTCTTTNGMQGCTTYIDTSDLSAQVPYSLVKNPGTVFVSTLTPQSGTGQNGLSNSLSFFIYSSPNPFPIISSVSPTSAAACNTNCAIVPITLTGTGFIPVSQNGGSSVTFTGIATGEVETAITVTSISSTQLKASIPGTYLCATDTAKINVINPPSAICLVACPDLGGGDTNNPPSGQPNSTQTFSITGSGSGCTTAAAALAVAAETPAVSQDGRYVAYAAMQGQTPQILLRDTCLGAAKDCAPSTRTLSVAADGSAGNGESHSAVMSSDGRYVAFSSAATNLVENASTGRQVYLRDTCNGAPGSCKSNTLLISTDAEGKLNGTEAILPSISSSGRFVAFLTLTASHAHASTDTARPEAADGANSGLRQVFVRDTCLGAANCTPKTTRISLQPGDAPADTAKPAGPALSGLAKHIALGDGKSSTFFTPAVPIDDRVFLAIQSEPK
jgi:WD40 repeat protein